MLKFFFVLLLVTAGVAKISTTAAQGSILEPSTKQIGASFGYSLAQDGEWLLVGSKNDTLQQIETGAAYFYKKENNEWMEWQKVGPNSGVEADLFGVSVALSGKYAVVGANGDDSNSLNSGAAYVYKLKDNKWEMIQKLLPNDGGFGSDEYGISVDLEESLLVVGAYSDFSNGPFSGAAYIYQLVGEEWLLQSKIFASDAASDDKFGRSVATDGRKVIVCGVLNDDLGPNSGSAYIFSEQNDLWGEEAKLLANDGTENDRFGRSVDIDLNLVAVGAVLDDDNGEQSGSVYLYSYRNQKWSFLRKIVPLDGQPNDFFGYSLSLYNPYLLVGAHNDDDRGLNAGSVYLFRREGENWTQAEKIQYQKGSEGDNFGEAVEINASYISIGMPCASQNEIRTGKVEVLASPVITGITDIDQDQDEINIYPNPATTEIYFEGLSLSELVGYEIMDVHGRNQPVPLLNGKNLVLDVAALKEGIYILTIYLQDALISQRIIISR